MEDRQLRNKNRKPVNYADLHNGLDEDDDDFKGASREAPAKKKAKLENPKPEKKKNLSRKNIESKSPNLTNNSSQQNKRLSVEERVFQRHMSAALSISKEDSKNVCQKDSSDSNSRRESKSSAKIQIESDDDDDFKPKSSPPNNKCNLSQKEPIDDKQILRKENPIDIVITSDSERKVKPLSQKATSSLPLIISEKVDSPCAENITDSEDAANSSECDDTEAENRTESENTGAGNTTEDSKDLESKTEPVRSNVSQILKEMNYSKVGTAKKNSPINLPTKGIRCGLSRKVRKPLHTGVQKMS